MAVGDLTDRHLVLRTVFSFDQNHDAWPIQVATATPVTLIEVASEDYEAASADLVAAGFDLATDTPLRLILASGSDADHRMTVVCPSHRPGRPFVRDDRLGPHRGVRRSRRWEFADLAFARSRLPRLFRLAQNHSR